MQLLSADQEKKNSHEKRTDTAKLRIAVDRGSADSTAAITRLPIVQRVPLPNAQ